MTQRLLRRSAVMDRLGVGRTTLVKMVKLGELRPPVVVSGTVRCWPEDEIDQLILTRIAASRDGANPPKE